MMHGGKKRRREVVLLNADELTGDLLGVEGAVLVLQRATLLDGDADAVRLRDGGGRSDECEGDGNEGGLAEHGGWSERDEGGAGEQVRGPEGRCLGVQGEKPGAEPGSWRRAYILESPAQDDPRTTRYRNRHGRERSSAAPWLPATPTWSDAVDHMALRCARREATCCAEKPSRRSDQHGSTGCRDVPIREWDGVVGQNIAGVRQWSFPVIVDEQHDDRDAEGRFVPLRDGCCDQGGQYRSTTWWG